ncbi:MAG: sugar ABC transporter permease, partial [Pseudomonadota bacterium]
MTDQPISKAGNAGSRQAGPAATVGGNPLSRFLAATEIDTRMLGMVGALALIWLGFHVMSGGVFLTPRNLWNLSVQSASVAVMST